MKILVNRQVLFTAVVAGFVLGLFLKAVENLTNKRVYTLLLNVDYFPVLKSYQFPEAIEFSFHLIISLLVVGCLFALRNRFNWSNSALLIYSTISQLIIGCVLYPTTTFSDRTPLITDVLAFTWWLVGHIIYGLIVGILLRKSK